MFSDDILCLEKISSFLFISGRRFEAILATCLKQNVGNLRNIYAGEESLTFHFQ